MMVMLECLWSQHKPPNLAAQNWHGWDLVYQLLVPTPLFYMKDSMLSITQQTPHLTDLHFGGRSLENSSDFSSFTILLEDQNQGQHLSPIPPRHTKTMVISQCTESSTEARREDGSWTFYNHWQGERHYFHWSSWSPIVPPTIAATGLSKWVKGNSFTGSTGEHRWHQLCLYQRISGQATSRTMGQWTREWKIGHEGQQNTGCGWSRCYTYS